MLTRCSFFASIAAAAASLPAQAQPIPWLNPLSGNWSDVTRWTGGNIPNAAGETAVLGLTGAYTVTQNVAGLTLDAIDVTNANVTLNLSGMTTTLLGAGLTNAGAVVFNTGTSRILGTVLNRSVGRITVGNAATLMITEDVTNDGLIAVNPGGGASGTSLLISEPVTIGGSGQIVLNAPTNRAQVASVDPADVLTLGPAQTLRGRGHLSARLINNGEVRAEHPSDMLVLNNNAKQNNGLARASGGKLFIFGVAFTQGPSGVVHADGSEVGMNSCAINGGSLLSTGVGAIRVTGDITTFNDVDSAASVLVIDGTTLALGAGNYTNNGTVSINPGNSPNATILRMDDAVTIDGTGQIVLSAMGLGAQISNAAGASLVLGPGQTVRGFGRIRAPMTNNGSVIADATGNMLFLDTNAKTNNGDFRASGGTLTIVDITLTQGPDATLTADGSYVNATGVTMNGGTIVSNDGGRVLQYGKASTLNNVDSTADVMIDNFSTLALAGGNYTNNGSIVVNRTGGSATTRLRIDDALTIDGTGEIILNSTGSFAQIVEGAGGVLTLGPGQKLGGIGQVAARTTIQGAVAPGLSVGTLTVNAPGTLLTWSAGSSLEIEIGTLASFDRITSGSHTIDGGIIDVTITGAYTPALFDTFTAIDGAAASVVTGRFDGVTGPALPSPWVWKVGYTAQDVIVGVSCPSDVNADFIVDIVDFLDFLDSFGSCENQPAPCGDVVDADYNGDTFVDILDFLDFFDAFGSGC